MTGKAPEMDENLNKEQSELTNSVFQEVAFLLRIPNKHLQDLTIAREERMIPMPSKKKRLSNFSKRKQP